MPTTQEIYRRNHSDVRAITRFAKDRERALRSAIKDRGFWLGEVAWATPASLGAQAALRTLKLRARGDALAVFAKVRPNIPAEHLGEFLRCKHACRAAWTH